MVINIDSEKLINLNKLRRLIPTHPSYNTLRKWISEGQISKATGKIVFLDSVQIGGRVFTSTEAYRRYLIQLNGYDGQWIEEEPVQSKPGQMP